MNLPRFLKEISCAQKDKKQSTTAFPGFRKIPHKQTKWTKSNQNMGVGVEK